MVKNIFRAAILFAIAVLFFAFRRRRQPQSEVGTIWFFQNHCIHLHMHEATAAETKTQPATATAPAHAEATRTTATPTAPRTSSPNGTHKAAASATATTPPPFTTTRPTSTATMDRPVDRCTDTIRHWDNLDTLGTLGLGQSPHRFGLESVLTPRRPETKWRPVDQEPSRPPVRQPVTNPQRSGPPPIKNRRNRLPWGPWLLGAICVGLLALAAILFGLYKDQEQQANSARVVAEYWEDQYKSTAANANAIAQERFALCPQLSSVQDSDFRNIITMSRCSIDPRELKRLNDKVIEYQMDRSIRGLQDDPRGEFLVAEGWTAEARIYTSVGIDTDTTGEIWNHAPSRKVYHEGEEFKSDRIIFVKTNR